MKIELVEKEPHPICMFCLTGRDKMLQLDMEFRKERKWMCLQCARQIAQTIEGLKQ